MLTVARMPNQFTAVYKSNTSVLLQWSYPYERDISTIKYVIYYQSEGANSSHDVPDSNKNNTYLLTGLPSGVVHNISIVAVSHLPSDVVGPIIPSMWILLFYLHSI